MLRTPGTGFMYPLVIQLGSQPSIQRYIGLSMKAARSNIQITEATVRDAPVILDLIRQLAEYERLADKVTATEDQLRKTLFGARPSAEVLLAAIDGETVGFAVFFTSYSTFLAKP